MKRNRMYKMAVILTVAFSVVLIITAFISLFKKEWGDLGLAAIIQVLILIPYTGDYFTRKKGFAIPAKGIIVYIIAIFLTFYMGDLHKFYYTYLWWDDVLHFLSGVVFTIAGFYIINIVNVKEQGTLITSTFFIVLFSFCFANTSGALWEIGEFIFDVTGLTEASQTDLEDTMIDMIFNMLGALLTSLWYYFYRRKKICSKKEQR
jgi:putative membrane protein